MCILNYFSDKKSNTGKENKMKTLIITCITLLLLVSCNERSFNQQVNKTNKNEIKLLVHLVGRDSVRVILWGKDKLSYTHYGEGDLICNSCDSIKINTSVRRGGSDRIATNITYVEEQ
jgi:hypothetical protein